MSETGETYLVIDNTAFAMGFNINVLQSTFENLQIFTTSAVYAETSKNYHSSQLLQIAQDQNLLSIEDPSEQASQEVQRFAIKTGDKSSLSQADQSLIALALDLKQLHPQANILLMSDDYAVQNVCAVMGLDIYSLYKKKIQKVIYWEIYCPHCHQIFPNDMLKKKCPDCETHLKRRPKKSSR